MNDTTRRDRRTRALFLGVILTASAAVGAALAPRAEAHGGGLNRCGCHHDRRAGTCHCHRDLGCGCECQPDRCE